MFKNALALIGAYAVVKTVIRFSHAHLEIKIVKRDQPSRYQAE